MIIQGTPNTGVFNSSQFLASNRRGSFAAAIARLFPTGRSPLFALTSMLPEVTAVDVVHGYYSKSMLFPTGTVVGATLAAATTLTLASNSEILVGTNLLNFTTGEQLFVTAVDAGGADITVLRAIGTTIAANIAAGEILYAIGNSQEESSLRPQSMTIQPVRVDNNTQIVRNTWALSRSASAVAQLAGDSPIVESRTDCMARHAADIEYSLLFGEQYTGTFNGQPLRKMRGVVSDVAIHAPTNVSTAGATTNWTQLNAMLENCLNVSTDARSSGVRTVFCGGTALQVINNIGMRNGVYELMEGQTEFGLQFKTFKTTRGTFNLIDHPLLNAFGSTSPFSKMAIVVDLSAIRIAYLLGSKTFTREFNTQGTISVDNGIDAVGGTITSELTLECVNPAANAVIYNFTAADVG